MNMIMPDNTVNFKSTPITGTELLIGCGNQKKKLLALPDKEEWVDCITLDIDPDTEPNVQWDLNHLPLPFENETFEEIHAYEILEHIGQQGDWKTFFAQFSEFYRILKPGGHFMATTPSWDGMWAWSDPGHSRIISEGTIHFLDQDNYKQIGKTPMTDYRHVYTADFSIEFAQDKEERFCFLLRKK